MANYFQAVELVFGAEKRGGENSAAQSKETDNLVSSLLAKLVLQDSACWQTMSALFNPNELEVLFKELYCLEIWHQLSADKIRSQMLAECLFNNALINDPPEVIHALQISLGITATGIMDEHTLACMQDISVLQLMKQVEQTLLYSDKLVLQDELAAVPTWVN